MRKSGVCEWTRLNLASQGLGEQDCNQCTIEVVHQDPGGEGEVGVACVGVCRLCLTSVA